MSNYQSNLFLFSCILNKFSIYTPSDLGDSSNLISSLSRTMTNVIFTALGESKLNRCRELGVLPKFQRKNILKIQECLSVDDFEGKKRLDGV